MNDTTCTDNNPILQGWLHKEKRSSSFVSTKMTKRWFVIENVRTETSKIDSTSTCTLSYYKSPRAHSDDRCGWIFLSDVLALEQNVRKEEAHTHSKRRKSAVGQWEEEKWIISIKHPTRVFRLRAQDRYQHRLWFQTLKENCPNLQGTTESYNQKVCLIFMSYYFFIPSCCYHHYSI